MFTKTAIANFKKNGSDNEKALALEIERLNALVVKWRNRVPADKRAEYAGKVPEIKHRWQLFFDGRSYEMMQTNPYHVTCTKGKECEECYPKNPYA